MLENINKRINELSQEAHDLVEKRAALHSSLDECNVRLTQIMGALQELEAIRSSVSGDQNGED